MGVRAVGSRVKNKSPRTPTLAAVSAMLGVILAALTSPAALAVPAASSLEQAGSLDGGDLYGRDCASCHGPDGRGSWRGPSLEGTGAAGNYYMLATGRMPIASPGEPVRRQEPGYSPEEIDALVQHVTTLVDGPDVPAVDLADADLALGGSLYRVHCGVCHSSTGIGSALAMDAFAPPVVDADADEVAAVMTSGAGAMPAFYPGAFTKREFDSVVAYVQLLREPVDRGVPFGRAGRVDEALAAWGVGIVTLLLLAGWIARAPSK